MTSAQGQDRSAYQDIYPWSGLNFGFAKATNGLGYTDPDFAANWANLSHANIPRGAYHELTASASMDAQAEFFVATVKGQGLRELDMLAVVASDYAGVSDGDVRAFCDEVRALAGPHNPVLVYTDLSVAAGLTSCTSYPLWVTWPNPTAPEDVSPWATWHFWQYSISGPVDLDAFNGTADDLRAWLGTYAAKPDPPPAPSYPSLSTSQEDNVMLIAPKTLTPLAIPPGYDKLLLVTEFGTTKDWQSVKVGIDWHGSTTTQYVEVNPGEVWPVVTVPEGVAGACLSIADGSHLVSVGLVETSVTAEQMLPDAVVLDPVTLP